MGATIREGRVHVTCDDCGTELILDPLQSARGGTWIEVAQDHGWTISRGGDATCPDCWDDTPAEQWEVTTPPAVYASDDEPGWVR